MSLILDALKKLDREKIERIEEKVDVTAGILRSGDSPRARSILPIAVTLGGTACAAAVITWLVVSGYSPRTGSIVPSAPGTPVQARQATEPALPAAPAAAVATPHAVPSAAPAPSPTAVPDAPPPVVSGAPPAVPRAAVSETIPPPAKVQKNAESVVKGKASAGVETSRKAEAAPSTENGPLPALKVSGIVWQELPSDRKAVINGRVAREGDTVEGARVLEIYPTFVNVSFKGKSYRVKMFD